MMRTIQRDIVGAFIFSKDGKLLLGKSRSGGVYADLWIPPGGGIEDGETKLDAVKREVLEEVGIDISGAQIDDLDYTQSGSSEKTLRDTGEHVLVNMIFYDFKITMDKDADAIEIKCADDISTAQWFDATAIKDLTFTEASTFTLKKLGYL